MMDANALLYPAFALVALTFIAGFRMGFLRLSAIRNREIPLRHFKLNEGAEVPAAPAQAANNYRNLFEAPVLFYALIALLAATARVDGLYVGLAWVFVASRYAHSFIHMGYNDVTHRFVAFVTGLIVLLLMWLRFLVQVL